MNSAGTATTKPAIGPAMPMSNSIRLLGIGSRILMNAPIVPVKRERHRDEKRQRRVDVIIPAREVVAELVAAENQQDGAAVPEAAEG